MENLSSAKNRKIIITGIFFGFILPYLFYILLSILYIGADPRSITFAEHDQWYDIPRNENIIIHLSKNWSNFSLEDRAYYKHPPLFFYLSALAFRLGNEVCLLQLMAFISICGVVATYFFIKELYGQKTALATAILLAYAPSFFDASFHVMFDNSTLLFYMLASLIIYKGLSRNSWFLTIMGGIVSGLMLLLKTAWGLLYLGCGVFILLMYYLKLIPERSFYSKLLKLTVSFLISLFIFLPWIIYQEINHGGYNWWKEFHYQLPWLKNAVLPPWYFYFIQAVSRWGWFFCGLIVLGLIDFFRNLKKHKNEQDIFFVSTSCVLFLFFTVWTIKSFRFLLPIFPFFIYLSILGISSAVSYVREKLNFKSHFYIYKGLSILFLIVVATIFWSKNLFVFKNIPGESPYKMASDYIKKSGLSADCYLCDERIIFYNYIQERTFWIRPNFDYNVKGIIGHNATIVVLNPSNKKYIPAGDQIKIFQANNKTVGVYMIDWHIIKEIKKRYINIEVKITDKSRNPLSGVFIYFYRNNELFFEGRTNKDGVANLLCFDENPFLVRVEAWGKMPFTAEVDPKELRQLKVQMEEGSFLMNGMSPSEY